MIFKQIPVGSFQNFAYLIGDEESGEAVVVDPAFEPARCLQEAKNQNLTIKYLINTHSHYDHTDGNEVILGNTAARLIGYGLAPPALSVADGNELQLGSLTLKILHTPGHTTDSICILVFSEAQKTGGCQKMFRCKTHDSRRNEAYTHVRRNDEGFVQSRYNRDRWSFSGSRLLITGDTLFVGTAGKTGLGDDARQQYESLNHKLQLLPPETQVYPGHDYGPTPSSTIGHEIKTNPYLNVDSFKTFRAIKKERNPELRE
ncbi:MAG: MBL fold metallo-hydrolase [Deltaproteobacteria bacterium]|nr:MBL fold metallo-hydrolase [Deltaproteobacteria bacterium]